MKEIKTQVNMTMGRANNGAFSLRVTDDKSGLTLLDAKLTPEDLGELLYNSTYKPVPAKIYQGKHIGLYRNRVVAECPLGTVGADYTLSAILEEYISTHYPDHYSNDERDAVYSELNRHNNGYSMTADFYTEVRPDEVVVARLGSRHNRNVASYS